MDDWWLELDATLKPIVQLSENQKSSTSQLHTSIALASGTRSIAAKTFEDPEKNTFSPNDLDVTVYLGGEVLVYANYNDIPDDRERVFLDGMSSEAIIETIAITCTTKGRKIAGFAPPTRLDQMSVEETARRISKGEVGLISRTSLDGNIPIIYGQVMPNSLPNGITFEAPDGSVMHVPDSPKNMFVFRNAQVDHRTEVLLGKGKGGIQVSYFTEGLRFSLEAVIVLSEPPNERGGGRQTMKDKDRTDRSLQEFDGDLSLYLRSQNRTATVIDASKLHISMAKVGPFPFPYYMRRERGRGVSSFRQESAAKESSSGPAFEEAGELGPGSIGPIDTFDTPGPVSIPTGPFDTWLLSSKLLVFWSLRYNMGAEYVTEPSIYVKVRPLDKDLPPLNATFLVETIIVGWARIIKTLPQNSSRFFHIGMDSMVEIQNTNSSRELPPQDDMIKRITLSNIKIFNRKSSETSLVLYWNLTIEDSVIKTEVKTPKPSNYDVKVVFIKDLTFESPEFATKMTDTVKVLVVYLYDLPSRGKPAKVDVEIHRLYPKPKHW